VVLSEKEAVNTVLLGMSITGRRIKGRKVWLA